MGMPHGQREFLELGIAGLLGLIGRLLFLARADRRRFGWGLLWEIPIAIGMGAIGKGLAVWFGLTAFPETAVIISVAYVGPRFIDALLDVALRRLSACGVVKGTDDDPARE